MDGSHKSHHEDHVESGRDNDIFHEEYSNVENRENSNTPQEILKCSPSTESRKHELENTRQSLGTCNTTELVSQLNVNLISDVNRPINVVSDNVKFFSDIWKRKALVSDMCRRKEKLSDWSKELFIDTDKNKEFISDTTRAKGMVSDFDNSEELVSDIDRIVKFVPDTDSKGLGSDSNSRKVLVSADRNKDLVSDKGLLTDITSKQEMISGTNKARETVSVSEENPCNKFVSEIRVYSNTKLVSCELVTKVNNGKVSVPDGNKENLFDVQDVARKEESSFDRKNSEMFISGVNVSPSNFSRVQTNITLPEKIIKNKEICVKSTTWSKQFQGLNHNAEPVSVSPSKDEDSGSKKDFNIFRACLSVPSQPGVRLVNCYHGQKF